MLPTTRPKSTSNEHSEPKPQRNPPVSSGASLRKNPPGTDPLSSKKTIFPVHKILAERRSKSNPRKTEYRVQWEPSWESASTVRGSYKLAEWERFKRKGRVFGYRGIDGREWTVLRDEVKWSDDSDERQWEMWCTIRRMVAQDEIPKTSFAVRRNWFEEFEEGDWEFASDEDWDESARLVGKNDELFGETEDVPVTALGVLKWSYGQLDKTRQPEKKKLLFGGLRIRFTGTLDTRDKAQEVMSIDEREEKRAASTVENLVRPLFANPFRDLKEKAFTNDDYNDTISNAKTWRDVMEDLIRKVPYILYGKSWVLLFALLLLRGEELRKVLKSMGIATRRDWNNHAREYGLLMYYEQVDDNREPHAIMETFLNLTTFFRELNQDAEDGEEGEEKGSDEGIETDGETDDDDSESDELNVLPEIIQDTESSQDASNDESDPEVSRSISSPHKSRSDRNATTEIDKLKGSEITISRVEPKHIRSARFTPINTPSALPAIDHIERRFSVNDDAEDEEYEPSEESSEDDSSSYCESRSRSRRKRQKTHTHTAAQRSVNWDHHTRETSTRRPALPQTKKTHYQPGQFRPANRNKIPKDPNTMHRSSSTLRKQPAPASAEMMEYFLESMKRIAEAERDPRVLDRQCRDGRSFRDLNQDHSWGDGKREAERSNERISFERRDWHVEREAAEILSGVQQRVEEQEQRRSREFARGHLNHIPGTVQAGGASI